MVARTLNERLLQRLGLLWRLALSHAQQATFRRSDDRHDKVLATVRAGQGTSAARAKGKEGGDETRDAHSSTLGHVGDAFRAEGEPVEGVDLLDREPDLGREHVLREGLVVRGRAARRRTVRDDGRVVGKGHPVNPVRVFSCQRRGKDGDVQTSVGVRLRPAATAGCGLKQKG